MMNNRVTSFVNVRELAMRSENSKTISMADVARLALVSKATVSKVLNGKPGVSEDTRARVRRVCEENGYRLNTSIQDLVRERRTGSTRSIAFVLVGKEFSDPAYSRFIDGIAGCAAENNFHLVFTSLTGNETLMYDLPPILRDGRVDGLLISGTLTSKTIAIVHKLGIPHVVLGNYSSSIKGHSPVVEINLSIGIYKAFEQLKLADKRRIAFFDEDLNRYLNKTIFEAFKASLQENDLTFYQDLVYVGAGSMAGAFSALKDLFSADKLPFDAIFCHDFRVASEISHLITGRFGLKGAIDIILVTSRPYSYYRLPVPAVYIDDNMDSIAYSGTNLLLAAIMQGEDISDQNILIKSTVEVSL